MSDKRFTQWWAVLLAVTIAVYIIGLFVTVMDVDAAQYAAISRQMYLHHDYLQTHCRNQNYLDKPPLLFWLSVLSFHIFGIHTWSYKLPSLLFTLIGIYATYKLAVHLYSKQTAQYASLILATCQAFFLFNTDVRTDTILTASIIVSIWQLYLYINTKKWLHAFIGFTFVALGMLAKGPLAACVPALALASQLAYQRRWKVFLWPVWWIGLGYILLLLSPMIYGLIEQYGWIGPRFFFWDQSFGRITGSNEWHNDAGHFYFFHTFLWAFLPWVFFTVLCLWDKLLLLVKTKFQYDTSVELITYGGFIIPFIVLSFSHYKLPHYIFNLFPLTAIFTAAGFNSILARYKWLGVVQKIFLLLVFAILFLTIIYLIPLSNIIIWAGVLILVGVSIYFLFAKKAGNSPSLLFGSAGCMLAVNLIMNAHFYPTLLTYQSGSNIGRYIHEHNIPTQNVCNYNYLSYAEDFYAGSWIGWINYLNPDLLNLWKANHEPHYLGGSDELVHSLDVQKIPYTIAYQSIDYPVTQLRFEFLNPQTRLSVVTKIYLIELK